MIFDWHELKPKKHKKTHVDKKKIEKRVLIFWEVGEVRRAAIFCLRHREEVGLSPGPNGAGYKTHRVPSYDLDTPSDAFEN